MAPNQTLKELGVTGLSQYSGVVQEEYLLALQGPRKTKVFREMTDNDPVIGAILFMVDMLIRNVDWRVEAAANPDIDDVDNPELPANVQANLIDTALHDMSHSWQDALSSIISFVPFGWSLHEIVYKQRRGPDEAKPEFRSKHSDSLYAWRKIPIRSQETLQRWTFDPEDGGVKAMVQAAPPDYGLREIPIEKSLLFRTTTAKANPEGRSALRNAYRPWYYKKRIEDIEGIGIERDLAGLPVAWVPPEWLDENATDEQKHSIQIVKEIVTNIRRDEQEGLVFPLQYDEHGNKLIDLSLMTTGGRRQFDTDAIIARYDQRIAMTVLGDFILLGHEKVGSYSATAGRWSLFAQALGAWLDEIASVMNTHAIPRLLKLNGMEFEDTPKLVHDDVEEQDIKKVADYIESLAKAGMPLFPNEGLEDYLLEMGNLPKREKTEEVD